MPTRLDRALLAVLTVLCEGAILLAVVGLLALGFTAAASLSGCDTITYCSPKGFLAGACPKFNDPPADGGQ